MNYDIVILFNCMRVCDDDAGTRVTTPKLNALLIKNKNLFFLILIFFFRKKYNNIIMLKITLKCFILWWTLLQIFFQKVKSQAPLFQPQRRILHTATYINNILYIFGGESTSTNPKINEITLKEFFYLDCSKSFVTTNLPWQYLP